MAWTLRDWWGRVSGLDPTRPPPLVPGVIPVAVVGDHSALTPQALPPLAWAGASHAAPALRYPGVRIYPDPETSIDGVWVEYLWLITSAGQKATFSINSTPSGTWAAGVSGINQQMGPDSLADILQVGDAAAVGSAQLPQIQLSQTGIGYGPFFVKRGFTFEVLGTTAASTVYAAALLRSVRMPPT